MKKDHLRTPLSYEPPLPKCAEARFVGTNNTDVRYSRYPSHPFETTILHGYTDIVNHIAQKMNEKNIHCIAIDGRPGVAWDVLAQQLLPALPRASCVDSAIFALPSELLELKIQPYIGGDDPIFGSRCPLNLWDLLVHEKILEFHAQLGTAQWIVMGPGAATILGEHCEYLIYVDLPLCEVQFRGRAGQATNLFLPTPLAAKESYKRQYFVDWPILEREMQRILPELHLFIDGQNNEAPNAVEGDGLRHTLEKLARLPLRPRPWFEPGVWGGKWIQEHLPGVNTSAPNIAWSFELIAPENGILFHDAQQNLIEFPFPALVKYLPKSIIGPQHAVFHDEFPIRFDFLDTVRGDNLSIQCHPQPEYISRHFGENFTQIESYYILDAEDDAFVYVGLKNNENVDNFERELRQSAEQKEEVAIEAYVAKFPSKKHDLFLIPPGVVHGAGSGNLVLEVSATPYIFTFKMYDWLRLDMDGKPRPLNLDRAFENISLKYSDDDAKQELLSKPEMREQCGEYTLEYLPTSDEHFYEMKRYTVSGSLCLQSEESVLLCMVVEGSAIQWSCDGQKGEYCFAETFLIPAACPEVEIRPLSGRSLILCAGLKRNLERCQNAEIRSIS